MVDGSTGRSAGDGAGGEGHLTRYDPLVFKLIYRYRLQERVDLEDLAQEGRFGVCLALSTYSERAASEFTWVYIVVRRVLIDYARKEKPYTLLDELSEKDRKMIQEETERLFREDQRNQEILREIEAAWDTLSPGEAEVTALKVQGYSYEEIQEATGTTPNTAACKKTRARRKIKEFVGE